MKILHTSDWHLGRALYGRKRYDEFEAFLQWLAATIDREHVDVLLVAGDVFDTSTPSNRAQELYYRFLCDTARSSCGHVVITAGNHDSPSFLDAPRRLLEALNVHVIGSVSGDLEDEVLVLDDGDGRPGLVVCAVPYLRDRDIRVSEAGESLEDKRSRLLEGIRRHYAEVADLAEKKRSGIDGEVPVVAMGHLFTAGGRTVDGDGVRELYVGTLAHVDTGVFPENIDYLALGHLHVPQMVGGCETRRYSGSPLPIGFGEAGQKKSVCLVEFHGTRAVVGRIDVPVFQELQTVRGDWDGISGRLTELSGAGSRAWVEVVYEGDEVMGDLRQRLETAVDGTGIEILRIRNRRIIDRVLGGRHDEESLDDLNEDEVFQRCLDVHEVPEEQRAELVRTYREAVASLLEDDRLAE